MTTPGTSGEQSVSRLPLVKFDRFQLLAFRHVARDRPVPTRAVATRRGVSFAMPSRKSRIRSVRRQIAQFCSLRFDDVEPSQQMGLTLRMLAIAHRLDDMLTYSDGVESCRETAFDLLGVSCASMNRICKIRENAKAMCDTRRFRVAFQELCKARHDLETSLLGRGGAQTSLSGLRRTTSADVEETGAIEAADGLSRSLSEPVPKEKDDVSASESTDEGGSISHSESVSEDEDVAHIGPPGVFCPPGLWLFVLCSPCYCHKCCRLCSFGGFFCSTHGLLCPYCGEELVSAGTMELLRLKFRREICESGCM